MRATMRITWLLLSLSVLSHNVCSEDNGQSTATSVSKGTTATAISVATTATSGGGATGPVPTQVNQPTGGQTTPQPSGGVTTKSETVQTPPAVNPTATDAPPVSTLDSTKKLPQDTTQPPATTVTEKPATPTPPPGAAPTQQNNASPAAVTSSQSKMVAQTGTTAGGGNSGQLPSGTTVQTSQTSGSGTVSWTTAPVTLPGDTVNAGTTKTPPASTDAHTTRQQSAAHTTVTSTTDVSKGGIDNTVVIVTSTSQPASKTEAPAGNTGTTSPLSSLTTTRSPAAGTTVAKTGTTSPQNTPTSRPAIIITSITSTTSTMTTTAAVPKTFLYSLNNKHEKEDDKDLVQVCQRLMANLIEGDCNLTIKHHRDKIEFISVLINGKVKTNQATQIYEEITKKPTDNKTLIAILASCGALLIMIVILAVCASHHRKPYNENQQHLTEELHTVENGYHDNPTLDVMEVQPEMKEKTMGLNGEFNDSWIVPIDNLLKEDMPDEEDTHL